MKPEGPHDLHWCSRCRRMQERHELIKESYCGRCGAPVARASDPTPLVLYCRGRSGAILDPPWVVTA